MEITQTINFYYDDDDDDDNETTSHPAVTANI
jgi:hypothetical protein